MVIYPKVVRPETKNAEKTVFRFLSEVDLGDGYYAYHSLLLPEHKHKLVGETDFLVLTPEGFLILEVKGGKIGIDKHGTWTTTNIRGNTDDLNESPFHQADENMFSVRNKLRDASLPYTYRKNLTGYGVIFPECKFELRTIETGDGLLLDEPALYEKNGLLSFIKHLERFWRNKIGGKARAFTPEEQKRIRHWLRPQFHSVRSLKSERIQLEDSMVGLLEDQMDFLVMGLDSKRTICRGGAGTGKTLVGLELARLFLERKNNVAYIVPNEILKGYLNSRGHKEPWIITIEELANLKKDSTDIIIVDEAQDVMSYPRMESIDNALKDGIENGRWVFFMDAQNQKGIDGVFEEECYEHVIELADRDFRLPRNIRNTIEIISETKKLTSRDIGRKGTGRGTTKYFEYKSDENLGEKIDSKLSAMSSSDMTPDMVAIIGPGPMSSSSLVVELKKHGHKFIELNENNCTSYPFKSERKITYSSAKNFKGMEAFVVIVDIGAFGLEALSSPEFYVAITRAVGHLIIAYPRSMRKQIADIEANNVKAIEKMEGVASA